MKQPGTKTHQKGAALIIGLILIAVSSLLVVTSMRGSRMQEMMTSNQNNKLISQMAAEAGAARLLQWVKDHSSDLKDASKADDAWTSSGFQTNLPDLVKAFDSNDGDSNEIHYRTGDFGAFWADKLPQNWSDDLLPFTIVGVSLRGDAVLAESALEIELENSSINAPALVSGADSIIDSPFTCFGEDCSVRVTGNSEVSGKNYVYEDCKKPPCFRLDDTGGGKPGIYLADVNSGEVYQKGSSSIVGEPRVAYSGYEGSSSVNDWLGSDGDGYIEQLMSAVDSSSTSNLDNKCNSSTNSPSGSSRDNPLLFIVDGVDVNCKGNMVGLITVKAGSSFSFNGNFHFEGLIVVMPGGKVDFSNGNGAIYGGVVNLAGNSGPCSEKGGAGCDLNLSGTADLRYSKQALQSLSKIKTKNSGPNPGNSPSINVWREIIQ